MFYLSYTVFTSTVDSPPIFSMTSKTERQKEPRDIRCSIRVTSLDTSPSVSSLTPEDGSRCTHSVEPSSLRRPESDRKCTDVGVLSGT